MRNFLRWWRSPPAAEEDTYEWGGSVYLRSNFPGQPDRGISGPAKKEQDWILFTGILFGLVMIGYHSLTAW